MSRVFFPVMKSPVPIAGRIGKKEWQDWYRTLVWVAENSFGNDRVLVVTNFVPLGEESEAAIYIRELKRLGVEEYSILHVAEGNETISQIEAGLRQARYDEEIVIVSTWLHAPRVWWLTRNLPVTRKVTFGIPRVREAFTDVALMFVFPIVDALGYRPWFLERVTRRRFKGVL